MRAARLGYTVDGRVPLFATLLAVTHVASVAGFVIGDGRRRDLS